MWLRWSTQTDRVIKVRIHRKWVAKNVPNPEPTTFVVYSLTNRLTFEVTHYQWSGVHWWQCCRCINATAYVFRVRIADRLTELGISPSKGSYVGGFGKWSLSRKNLFISTYWDFNHVNLTRHHFNEKDCCWDRAPKKFSTERIGIIQEAQVSGEKWPG